MKLKELMDLQILSDLSCTMIAEPTGFKEAGFLDTMLTVHTAVVTSEWYEDVLEDSPFEYDEDNPYLDDKPELLEREVKVVEPATYNTYYPMYIIYLKEE